MRLLTDTECREAMGKGEFTLPAAAGIAAVILTQSWCPQWKAMKNYLPEAEKRLPGLEIFFIEYDQVSWFEEFMAWKENTFNNREIPYVRYYRNSSCTGWSNYVALEGFLYRVG